MYCIFYQIVPHHWERGGGGGIPRTIQSHHWLYLSNKISFPCSSRHHGVRNSHCSLSGWLVIILCQLLHLDRWHFLMYNLRFDHLLHHAYKQRACPTRTVSQRVILLCLRTDWQVCIVSFAAAPNWGDIKSWDFPRDLSPLTVHKMVACLRMDLEFRWVQDDRPRTKSRELAKTCFVRSGKRNEHKVIFQNF